MASENNTTGKLQGNLTKNVLVTHSVEQLTIGRQAKWSLQLMVHIFIRKNQLASSKRVAIIAFSVSGKIGKMKNRIT